MSKTVTIEKEKSLTLEYVADLILKGKLISPEDRKEIFIKGESQRARLHKMRQTFSSRRHQTIAESVSPAEVIASFNFKTPETGKLLTEDVITVAIAKEVDLPYIKIDPLQLDLDVVTSKIPRPFAQRHLIVPIAEENGVVTLAVADPFNLESIDNLTRTSKMKVSLVLASKSDILRIVREFHGFRSSVVAAEQQMGGTIDLGNLEQFVKLKGANEIEATDQHIVKAVEYLLYYAYDQGASDIHIEPKREITLVRLRIDGVLHNIHTIPKPVHPSVVSRIKTLSRLDIAEKRRPQDGRIKTEFHDREIELRISTMPTAFGEKIVIRIFDPDILCQDIKDLGFYNREYEAMNTYLKKTYGIVLVTGPTGSGKTTTLYSALRSLASSEVNIVTIEDPIEMVIEEFNQVAVQPKVGLDFASTLRTILRQDPDIIMVGEIRDKETASNAVQAALTGHLVLSTLHTNDAPTSVTRLIDLGVPPFLISATVLGIAAQRLVRKICKDCKKERPMRPEEIEFLGLTKKPYTIHYGEGCVECRGTGYKGRDGIFELMDFSDKIKELTSEGGNVPDIRKTARSEGMISLRESAIKKMLEGITTYDEVISVTS